jgi:hypothetical protein
MNVIPKQKSITISGSTPSSNAAGNIRDGNFNWKITIDDKYNVIFSGDIRANNCGHSDNNGWSSANNNAIIVNRNAHVIASTRKGRNGVIVTYGGKGSLIWDNDKMKIILNIEASGHCDGTFYYDLYEGSGNRERSKTVSESEDIYSYGTASFPLTFDLQSDYNSSNTSGQLKILLSQNTLKLNMYENWSYDMFGKDVSFNYSCTNSSSIGGNTWYTASIIRKSESELNASSNDQFGEWSWNADRTRLFLKSKMSDNKFVIINDNGKLSWCMEMVKGAKGTSESTTEKGDKLVNLSMAFDGATVQVFSFIENTSAAVNSNFIQLDYAVYNRFLGTMDKRSDVILNQIKDKSMLVLTYTVNGAQKTDMFVLEGLDTIMEYLGE